MSPGRRLERTSSQTGNNAESNRVAFKLFERQRVSARSISL